MLFHKPAFCFNFYSLNVSFTLNGNAVQSEDRRLRALLALLLSHDTVELWLSTLRVHLQFTFDEMA